MHDAKGTRRVPVSAVSPPAPTRRTSFGVPVGLAGGTAGPEPRRHPGLGDHKIEAGGVEKIPPSPEKAGRESRDRR